MRCFAVIGGIEADCRAVSREIIERSIMTSVEAASLYEAGARIVSALVEADTSFTAA